MVLGEVERAAQRSVAMNLLKSLWAAVALAALAAAEPALPGQYQYLPPDQNGYNYPTPKVPFQPTPPPYRPSTPTPPPYRPPTTPPSYGTPPPTIPPTRPTYGPPGTFPPPVTYPPATRPTYGPPPGDNHDHHHHHEPGMPFDFAYAVKDDLHGADYAHSANSNGDVVTGEYRNLLPDGRLQIVRYTADWATGFHADVSYQGEAKYPAPAPAPAYGPPQQQQQPPQQTGY